MYFDVYGYKQVKCLEEIEILHESKMGWWEKACCYDPVGK
ncbi:MAG: hypothetical protein IH991_23355, partial [Planctomycetes bacterium]|nr:hypothetical protein [Planctomycetota bacterium]